MALSEYASKISKSYKSALGVARELLPTERIPRNALYRERRIRIEYKPPNETMPVSIELTEVSDVDVDSTSDVAIAMGPMKSVIQPWYPKPFNIVITGKSYIGAYDTTFLSPNIVSDTDIEKLIRLRDHINQKFQTTGRNEDATVKIEYGDLNNVQDLSATQIYEGVFAGLRIREGESPSYIKTYTLRFIGQCDINLFPVRGARNFWNDAYNIAKYGAGKVGQGIKAAASGATTVVGSLPSIVGL